MNLNLKAKEQNTYDAIVIGSGISGGWAAKELTEKGLKTIVLERGRTVEHIKDYPTATKAPWEFPHRGKLSLKQLEDYPKLKRTGFATNEEAIHFFVKDTDHPYLEEKRFDWVRGWQVGGKSLTWGRVALRWSDLDFEANAKEGIAVDWPIRYKDIAPWYDYVETFAGISGNRDGIPHLPDGLFQPPMDLTCVDEHLRDAIKTKYPDRYLIHTRQAHITKPTKEQLELGRVGCQARNMCWRGCPYGGYFSSQAATLPAAKRTGNLTIRPHSIVSSIMYDEKTGKASGVQIVDENTKETMEFYAKVIFVNASAMGSTFILMNSKSNRFPNGLGNDSGELGHNLMDHHFNAGAGGTYEGFGDKYEYGRRPNGFYVARYRNVGKDKRDYVRGFGYEGGSNRPWAIDNEGFGESLKENYAKIGPWNASLGGFAETLPHHDNKVILTDEQKDPWGLPVLKFSAEFGDNEKKMRVDMINDAAEMLELAGFKDIYTFDNIGGMGLSIHEMGTARMGHDAKSSVLNKHNQVWGCENVFVTDGACMTSSSCVNPSLTYMALTARAADYAVNELKKRNL